MASGINDMSKTAIIQFLENLLNKKVIITPHITTKHNEKRLNWAKRCMITIPYLILFADICRATLDSPDGWSKRWVYSSDPSYHALVTSARQRRSKVLSRNFRD